MSKLKNLMRAARESIEAEENLVSDLSVDETQEAMDDTGLTGEIVEEVAGETDDLDNSLAEVDASVADADALGATADRLEASLDNEGAGADPLAAELVQDQLEAAVERHGLTLRHLPARESFGTSKGRRDSTRAFIAAAREAEADLKSRIRTAYDAAVKWVKEIWAVIADKSVRVEKRAKALVATAGKEKFQGGKEVKFNDAMLVGLKPLELVHNINRTFEAVNEVVRAMQAGDFSKEIVVMDGDKTGMDIRLTPGGNGKLNVHQTPAETEGSGDTVSLSSEEVIKVASACAGTARAARENKKEFDVMVKKMGAFTGESPGNIWNDLLSASACTRAIGQQNRYALTAAAKLLDLCDKSMKTGAKDTKARAPADKAATAASAAAA